MKKLWAPWRMEYIEGFKEGECIFCTTANAGKDEANLILHRGTTAFVIMNRYPYANGHLMVAPFRHLGDIEALTPAEALDLFTLVQKSVVILKAAVNAEGFNVGINIGRVAGAGITDHVHIHIVPRWQGDVNFMPLLGDTKVICEYLTETYKKLKPKF
jgi:ATP adenylyltransferase